MLLFFKKKLFLLLFSCTDLVFRNFRSDTGFNFLRICSLEIPLLPFTYKVFRQHIRWTRGGFTAGRNQGNPPPLKS